MTGKTEAEQTACKGMKLLKGEINYGRNNPGGDISIGFDVNQKLFHKENPAAKELNKTAPKEYRRRHG